MPIYPSGYDSLPAPVDGVSEIVAADIVGLADAIAHVAQAIGLSGDTHSSSGGIYARVGELEDQSGGIFKQTTAPSSPATDALWLDTDDAERPVYDFRASVWALIGANALALQGTTVDATAPTNGQVLTYSTSSGKWAPAAQTGGTTNPLTTEWGVFVGGAVSGGVAAPAELALGTTIGQVLGVVAGPALGWITPNYMPIPSGTLAEGVFPLYTGGTWTAQGPGSTSGYAWTSNGPGAAPTWQVIPVSPPGSGMAVPSSPRVGAVISYDEHGDPYWLLPGAAGTVLTAHGDNNIVGSKLTWVAPSAGSSVPFTTTGDTLYSSDNSGTPARLPIATSNAANKFLGIAAGAPAWKTLGGTVVDTYLDFTYGSAPSTPAASTGRLYAKTATGKVYFKNAVGTEYDLTGGGGGSSFYQTVRNATNTADMTGRGTLRFTGTALNSITDDSGSDATIINYDTPAVFGASGGGHTTGVVPDPGSSAGSTRFLREDATWATPSGGGGGGPYTQPPTVSGASWLNQGSATATDLTSGIKISHPGGSGNNLRAVILEAAPSPTWTRYFQVDPVNVTGWYGLVIYSAGSGQALTVGINCNGTSSIEIKCQRWTSFTVINTTRVTETIFGPWSLWFRISDNGSNMPCDISRDGGQTWRNILNDASSWFTNTPTSLAFGADNNGTGSATAGVLRSYSSSAPDPTIA